MTITSSLRRGYSSLRSYLQHRWLSAVSAMVAAVVILLGGWLLLFNSSVLRAQSGLNCSGQYLVDVTLPTGGRWEMCWEQRNAEGIVLYDVYYTTPTGIRRSVLGQANLAQIHVPYDDNGARFYDLSDYGLGGNSMIALTAADCPGGTLLADNGKNVICLQVQPRGYEYKYYNAGLQGYELSLFSVSGLGEYNYIPLWKFMDNGIIEPSVQATGRLQRWNNDPSTGWKLGTNGAGDVYGIAHTHNYYWRLDFDIDGPANDAVDEINFSPTDSTNSGYSIAVTPLTVESARDVDPSHMRSWRIRDTVTNNADGMPISYQLEPMRVGHHFQGPAYEPFTNHQFYVTTAKACEQWVSHNPTSAGCGDNVTAFVNGESLVGQDIVVWYGITFHHLPRNEDESMMDAHTDGFDIVPRDWTATNPMDTVGTPTPTDTPVPATATDTPIPPTATSTTAPATATSTTIPAIATATDTLTPPPATDTSTATPTDTPTGAPIGGSTATATDTPTDIPAVPTATATNTPDPGVAGKPTPTDTPTGTPIAAAGQPVCRVFNSSDVPKALPNGALTTSSNVTVSASLRITDINVSAYITHTYVGDVGLQLVHVPSGRSVTILDRPGSPPSVWGCLRNDLNLILDDSAAHKAEGICTATQPTINGTFVPNNQLSAFNGLDAAGVWQLKMSDSYPVADDGVLQHWGIQICGVAATGAGSQATPVPQDPPFGISMQSVPVGEDTSPPRVNAGAVLDKFLFMPVVAH